MKGAATTGRIAAKIPNPQRQYMWVYALSDAGGPAKAVIIQGEAVNAYANPRFLSVLVSAVTQSIT